MDDATIREFLSRDYRRLVNAVAMVSGSYPAAEDAVQEALVRAWQRSSKGEEIDSLPNWVAAVALNLSKSGRRRAKAERRVGERLALAAVGRQDPSETIRVDLLTALAALPRRQREVAVLRYLLRMTTKETATTLGVGEGTVKNSLSHARGALATALRIELEADDADA